MVRPSSLHYLTSASPCNVLALILAGGQGTRMQHLTRRCAKPAVPFGGRFRNIDFTLSNCVNSQIRRVGVLTQYQSQSVIQHIHKGWNLFHSELGEFLELLPAQTGQGDNGYRGTADAVYQNLALLRRHSPDYTLILAGDHIYTMDYREMISHHLRRDADMTIACTQVPVQEAGSFGVMGVDEQWRIHSFQEKPERPAALPGARNQALVSMGIYLFNTDFLCDQLLLDAFDPTSGHDFGRDLIPKMIRDYQISAFPFRDRQTGSPSYWRDIGTVESYWQANMDLLGDQPDLDLYDRNWPIRTSQDQLPPAKFIAGTDGTQGIAIESMVSPGCIIRGAAVQRSLLFPDVEIQEGSRVNASVILPGAVIGRQCSLERVIVEQDCVIPDGTHIAPPSANVHVPGDLMGLQLTDYHPAHYYVSPNGVTLVTREMFAHEVPQLQYA